MKSKLKLGTLLLFFSVVPACSGSRGDVTSSSAALRELSEAEVLGDLDFLGSTLHLEYGGLAYKKARFGFDLDTELAVARTKIQAATTEGDRIRPFYELLAKLKDGHVGLSIQLRSDTSVESSLAITVAPIDGAYYVSSAPLSVNGLIRFGDKLVAIDGLTTDQLEALLFPLTEIGTPAATRHRVATQMTSRPFYAPANLQPLGPNASVTVEHLDGTTLTVDVPWTKKGGGVAGQSSTFAASIGSDSTDALMLSPSAAYLVDAESQIASGPQAATTPTATSDRYTPFYLTSAVRQQLGVVSVSPKPETLTKFGVSLPPAPVAVDGGTPPPPSQNQFPLRAYKYQSAGKTILLVRIPTFSLPFQNNDANVGWLGALLTDNLAPSVPSARDDANADVVVVDVTRNAGGSTSFSQGVASMFTTKPIPNIVQATRANRLLVDELLTNLGRANAEGKPIWQKRLDDVQAAYDRGDYLAPFMPLSGGNLGPTIPFVGAAAAGSEMLNPHPLVQWNKPVLILTDELSSSAGDAFPAMLQHGGAKTFGSGTSGAGGTVKSVSLPNSAATFQFPSGLFGPYDAETDKIELVENNGVLPDYPYALSIYDFRGGYVGYAAAFTSVAVGMVSQ